MSQNSDIFSKFIGVIAKTQTYLNFIYLFIAFPLGLVYFIFLVVGISVGVATLILWVGLLVLLVVIAGWWLLAGFERVLAISLLNVDIPPMTTPKSEKAQTSLEKLGAFLSNPVTWKGLVYLFAKFPLGIISFVVLVTFTVVSIVLVTSPFTYQYLHPEIWLWGGFVWRIDTLGEASMAMVAGILMVFVSLNIFNLLAWISGKFALIMLGNPQKNGTETLLEPSVPQTASSVGETPAEPRVTHDDSVDG